MTTDPDLYLVLGVEPSASASQITHAYRTLMRRHHPDTRISAPQATQSDLDQDPNQAHDAALQQVAAAYAVLRDSRQRADYDARRTERARRDQEVLPPEGSNPARPAARHTGPPVFLGELAGGYPPRPLWIVVR
jgi:curved DNA-binding protein CbpA